MSSQPDSRRRHERRLAAVADRRAARRPVGHPGAVRRRGSPVGIGAVSLAALVAGVLVVAVALVLGGRPKEMPATVAIATAPAGIASRGYVIGNPAAPVTIDLYEDFQCPACLAWGTSVYPGLVRNELAAGTVRIAYHPFAFIGQESRDAARAAYAAAQQGRFWDMWATLYANQGGHENGGSFARVRLDAMASALGLDAQRFAADIDSPEAIEHVSAGAAAARAAGIDSTPTLLINGTIFTGSAYPALAIAIGNAAR